MAKKSSNPKADLQAETPSFEAALAKLSEVVRQLEEGNLTLDESLARYEQGIRHLSQCQKLLAVAERKIELLSGIDADGNPTTQRFEDEEMSLEEKAKRRSRRRTAQPSEGQSSHVDSVANRPAEDGLDDVDVGGTLF